MSWLGGDAPLRSEGGFGGRMRHPDFADREMMALEIAASGLLNGAVALMVARKSGDRAEVLFANDAFLRLTGYPLDEVLGRNCSFLRGPDTQAEISATLDAAFVEERFCDLEVLHYRRDGTPFWNGVTISPMRDTAGDAGGFLIFMRDVTARRRADDRSAALADRLRDLAMSDPLTGIANRRSFDAMLDREWRRAGRTGNCTTLAMIDIDHFKSFNDNFGHPAGDTCLKTVASALGAVIRRPSDFLARYGGEEFAVMMPNLDREGALEMGQLLVSAMRDAAIAHPCQPLGRVSISCGVVSAFPASYEGGLARFIREADRALYQAKAAGRDQVHQAEPDGQA